MQQTNMIERVQAEQRTLKALEGLVPDGDVDGAMLRRYTQWDDVHEIPIEEMGRVCVQAEKESKFRKYLGDARYFDHITAGAKIRLYKAALIAMEDALPQMGHSFDEGIFFEKFRTMLNLCLKECELSLADSRDFPGESIEPTPQSGKETIKKGVKKISKNDKSCTGQKISKNDIRLIKEIVEYLNQKAGRSFRIQTAATQRQISARLHDGYAVEDFKRVIDDRVAKWNRPPEPGAPDMREYLCPSTLFSPSNFEKYLQAAGGKPGAAKRDLLDNSADDLMNFQLQREE